jgi:nitric oxide reductase subunit C
MRQSSKYFIIIVVLLAFFLLYNFTIYKSKTDYGSIQLSEKALNGESIWLQNNCNSCHQLYGLGGYLGPDLTNVYSIRNKNEYYIKAMLNSGVKSMPKFHFNKFEKEVLIQFLKEVDQTGYYPNANSVIETNGWVSIKYKNENHGK